ncbi:RNA polymerase sigma factor [Paenibacillus lemnae]|uniref:Sigma-70 family RNA polymerase sigma factor n=1 Tax=Paenibacillus lemnae TaxID=1330551 RepID=A0A848M5G7_PAELE|nr:sigma-70 family RNA polymerase sigma factor [Paenibacillus lemnae]NMO95470.1 sigma-70 family RNA polymerase sigma factor [Paenibacillus lemnae]
MQSRSLRPGEDITQAVQNYGKMLFKIAMIHLGSKEDAEEAIQETFIKLMKQEQGFQDQEHVKAWLIRVLINHCKNMRRSLWKSRVVIMDALEDYFYHPEERSLMEHVLGLPFKYKTVIHLFYYEGYSVRQIADIVQISQSAVKMRLARGRKLLKMDLEGVMEA